MSWFELGYQWVISGLSVGYQRVIRGLSEGYRKMIGEVTGEDLGGIRGIEEE